MRIRDGYRRASWPSVLKAPGASIVVLGLICFYYAGAVRHAATVNYGGF